MSIDILNTLSPSPPFFGGNTSVITTTGCTKGLRFKPNKDPSVFGDGGLHISDDLTYLGVAGGKIAMYFKASYNHVKQGSVVFCCGDDTYGYGAAFADHSGTPVLFFFVALTTGTIIHIPTKFVGYVTVPDKNLHTYSINYDGGASTISIYIDGVPASVTTNHAPNVSFASPIGGIATLGCSATNAVISSLSFDSGGTDPIPMLASYNSDYAVNTHDGDIKCLLVSREGLNALDLPLSEGRALPKDKTGHHPTYDGTSNPAGIRWAVSGTNALSNYTTPQRNITWLPSSDWRTGRPGRNGRGRLFNYGI